VGTNLLFGSVAKKPASGSLRFAEFFAGIGLVRMGLEAAEWSCLYANDIDPVKRRQYDEHFGDADEHFALGDVHAVKPETVPNVDLATASFPCTDLSVAGGRAGLRAGESSAFWGFVEVIRGMKDRRPPMIMLENVTGFLSSRKGEDFLEAMRALNGLGYSVDVVALDAKWFVPQSRPRLFVVGSTLPAVAVPAMLPSRTRPPALVAAILKGRDIQWRLSEHESPPLKSSEALADILDEVPSNSPQWWDSARKAYFFDQLSERHLTLAKKMMEGRAWSYATAFRRVRAQADGTSRSMAELRTDGIAGCLRTPKGGSGRQILFRAGKGRYDVRLLNPRECARLMGAGDFRVSGSLNEALFGFGDAVCVPAVTWLAQHVFPVRVASDNAAPPRRVHQ
jgi:DNA (cytosine-5)-methyltransferase 1